MTDLLSHYAPDTSVFLFETCYSTEEFTAKWRLDLIAELYSNAVRRDPSSLIVQKLRKRMIQLDDEITRLRNGSEQTSLEAAQTRKGEGSF